MALSFKSFPESQLRHLSTASASSSTLTLTSKAARGRPFPTVRRQHGPWRRPGWSWSHSESPGSLSGECGRVRYPQPVVSSPVVLELLMGQIIKLKHLIVASSAQPCMQASSAQVLGKQCPGLGVCGGGSSARRGRRESVAPAEGQAEQYWSRVPSPPAWSCAHHRPLSWSVK